MAKHNYQLYASILSADFACLGEEARSVLAAGADAIHFDVMDNHYVPNLTVGPLVCKALREHGISAPIDVHLMVEPVDELIPQFIEAGANCITIHPEATKHLDRSLQLIKSGGCKAGLAFNPATPLDYLEHVMEYLDLILMMSVNPGFGGQKFIPSSLKKIDKVKTVLNQLGHNVRLAVDGGVKIENIKEIANAGADTFIVGSGIFNTEDYPKTIGELLARLNGGGH